MKPIPNYPTNPKLKRPAKAVWRDGYWCDPYLPADMPSACLWANTRDEADRIVRRREINRHCPIVRLILLQEKHDD